jgi:hypothetical protein
MAAQDQPHENFIFPEEVLPRGNAQYAAYFSAAQGADILLTEDFNVWFF